MTGSRTTKAPVRIAVQVPTSMRACAANVTGSRSTSEGQQSLCTTSSAKLLRIRPLPSHFTALPGGAEARDPSRAGVADRLVPLAVTALWSPVRQASPRHPWQSVIDSTGIARTAA
jgi:hypothetical protein